MRIKIFSSDSLSSLEYDVNSYLSNLTKTETDKVDIKYQVEHRTITGDQDNGEPYAEHIIILIFN
jgi:hypothetical protein